MSCWLWVLVILVAVLCAVILIGIALRFSRIEEDLRDLEHNTPPFTDWRRTLERNKPRTTR